MFFWIHCTVSSVLKSTKRSTSAVSFLIVFLSRPGTLQSVRQMKASGHLVLILLMVSSVCCNRSSGLYTLNLAFTALVTKNPYFLLIQIQPICTFKCPFYNLTDAFCQLDLGFPTHATHEVSAKCITQIMSWAAAVEVHELIV